VKTPIAASIVLAVVLSVAPAMAASNESVSGKEPTTFRALSKLPTGERAGYTLLTDAELASVEGASSWSNEVVINQVTQGGGINTFVVTQQNGESTVVEQQSGGNNLTEAMMTLKLFPMPLLLSPPMVILAKSSGFLFLQYLHSVKLRNF
jgi:hypothetical protein